MNTSFIWNGPGWYASRQTWDDNAFAVVITEKFSGEDASGEEAEAQTRLAGYGTPVFYEFEPE